MLAPSLFCTNLRVENAFEIFERGCPTPSLRSVILTSLLHQSKRQAQRVTACEELCLFVSTCCYLLDVK
jgi:hypothetical protein